MKKQMLIISVLFGVITSSVCQPNPKGELQKSALMMGVNSLQTIRYSGSGTSGIFGQNYSPHSEWPILIVKSYTRTIDYSAMSSSEEVTRSYQVPPARGGGAAFLNEQKQSSGVSGMPPSNDALDDRHLNLLVTPHGFLKLALTTTGTTVHATKNGAMISIPIGKYRIEGEVNKQGLVEKVRTWTSNPVLGDILLETVYSNYKDYKGIKFPSHILQSLGGHMTLDITLSGVEPNITGATPPAFPSVLAVPVVKIESTLMSKGVWLIGGGSHNSLLVEFNDYVAVFDAPNNDARSIAVMEEVKRLIPSKSIKYVINSHHHFDHSGGLRAYVAGGSTVITSGINPSFYAEAWKAPRTLAPDLLSQHPKDAVFIGVEDKYVLSDGSQTLELYHNLDSNHNAGMLFGYLPKEKILFVVDEYSQGRLVNGSLVPVAKGFANNLYLNLERLNLDIQTVAPGHGSIVSFSEMESDLGK